MQVSQCDVYRLEDSLEAGGFRYLLVEPFLDGKYIKVRGERRGGKKEGGGGVGSIGENVLHFLFVAQICGTGGEQKAIYHRCDHFFCIKPRSV